MRISDWSSDVCSSDLQPMPFSRWVAVMLLLPSRRRSRSAAPRAMLPSAPVGCARFLRRSPALPAPHARNSAPARSFERSEEHTSELQSLMRISYAVFCLQKKKHKNYIYKHIYNYVQTNQTRV